MRRHTLHPTSVTLLIAVGVSHAHIGLLDVALAYTSSRLIDGED